MRCGVVLGLVMAGCSAPTEPVDEADADEGALAWGTQKADFTPGTYMADDGSTVRVEARALGQRAALRLLVDANGGYPADAFVFAADVATKGLKSTVADAITPTKKCDLEIEKLAAGLAVRGTCMRDANVSRIDRTFAPRAPNWLSGHYASTGWTLDVTQSTEALVAFTANKDGKPVFSHAGGGQYDAQGFAYDATDKACRFMVFPQQVRAGRIASLTLSATSGPCPFDRVVVDAARP